jgi:uncharacterized protein with HEPN domain
MRAEDRIRILHMIEAAETVGEFIAGRQRGDLDSDRMLLFAVVRAIELIGEAASKVTEETRMAAPAIPWNAITGMRNRLVHGYFDVDIDIVWETANREVPKLLNLLRTQMEKE